MLWPAFEEEGQGDGGDAVPIAKAHYSGLTLTFIHLLMRFSAITHLITPCPVRVIESFCLGVKETGRLRRR